MSPFQAGNNQDKCKQKIPELKENALNLKNGMDSIGVYGQNVS